MTQTAFHQDDIYQWNEVGICHLEARRLDDSIHCFRMALSLARSAVFHSGNALQTNVATSTPSKAHTATATAVGETRRHYDCLGMGSTVVGHAEDRTDDVLHDYLYMQPQPLRTTADPEPHLGSVCVTCLFNLSVAVHLKTASWSSEARDHQSERLAPVVQLYEHVYALLRSGTCNTRGGLHVLIATLNNLAMVHNQCGRPDQAKASFETLLSSIMCITTSDGSRCHTFDSLLLDGVFSNVSKALGILTAPIYAPGA
jgi:hypothetical protein